VRNAYIAYKYAWKFQEYSLENITLLNISWFAHRVNESHERMQWLRNTCRPLLLPLGYIKSVLV